MISTKDFKNKPKWEQDFLLRLSKTDVSDEFKEILNELDEMLEETSQGSGSSKVDLKKKEYEKRIKELDTRISYLAEYNRLIEVKNKVKELDSRIKIQKDAIKTLTEESQKELKEKYEKEVSKLEAQREDFAQEEENLSKLINALHRKMKTIQNRLERALYSGFGSLIKARRTELGLSLKDIEEVTGISPSYINRIEKGQRKAPSYRIIEQLANVLDIPVSKLINASNLENGEEIPSLKELILTNEFSINNKRVSKETKEKIVEFIDKFMESEWAGEKKYEEMLRLMSILDSFKDKFKK